MSGLLPDVDSDTCSGEPPLKCGVGGSLDCSFSAADLERVADNLRQCATLLLVDLKFAGDSDLVNAFVEDAETCRRAALLLRSMRT